MKDDYVKAAIAEVVEDLEKKGLKLKGKAFRPFDSAYRPELDVTEELDETGSRNSRASLAPSDG